MRHLGSLLIVLEGAVALFLAIKRDPEDRVLFFEILAIGTFFLGAVIVKLVGVTTFAACLWLVLFFGFVILAAYFALINWLDRRKKVT
jgi:hypothetical protein